MDGKKALVVQWAILIVMLKVARRTKWEHEDEHWGKMSCGLPKILLVFREKVILGLHRR